MGVDGTAADIDKTTFPNPMQDLIASARENDVDKGALTWN
jgi:hypothetical protein